MESATDCPIFENLLVKARQIILLEILLICEQELHNFGLETQSILKRAEVVDKYYFREHGTAT